MLAPLRAIYAVRRWWLPPMILLTLYDALRYVAPLSLQPHRVIGCELRAAELRLFGIREGGAIITPGDVFMQAHCALVDVICAVPYGSYLAIMGAQYAYLCAKRPLDARLFARIAIGTHLLAFVTYIVLPAAPPWYVAVHGCVIGAYDHSSPAALQRVDALVGVGFFHALYAQCTYPFGALPSLHVTYPLYGIFATFAHAGWLSKLSQLAYLIVMVFAAVYLGHHYIIDVLLGLSYATIVFVVVK